MFQDFILSAILLGCFISFSLGIDVIDDDYHKQTVLVDKHKFPFNIALGIACYPNSVDDGTCNEVYLRKKSFAARRQCPVVPLGASISPEDEPRFYLYTKKNSEKPVELSIEEESAGVRPYFNQDGPVKIICHGFDSNTEPFTNLTKKYLDLVKDANVILVDWEKLAKPMFSFSPYVDAAKNVMIVGERISALIQRLVKDALTDLDKIHFIGHSLGAHIGGAVGHDLSKCSESKISRITGLDPAGPSFCSGNLKRLSPEDANYVDVIHTAIPPDCVEDSTIFSFFHQTYGLNMSIGHSDFYPNGGADQPGCAYPDSDDIGCSHSRSYHLLEESIGTEIGFHACKCNWSDYENKKCICKDTVLMGEHCPITAKGNFFLKTGPKHPFAKLV